MKKLLGNSIHNAAKAVILAVFMTLSMLHADAQISVTATAGTLGPTAYTTLRNAVVAINAGTHRGVINISVTANTTETAQSSLNSSGTGASSYTSITIKPAAAATPTIQGNIATNCILQLLGADNVTIDGSNTAGGTTRDLTMKNTNTGTTSAVVWIASPSATDGATNNIIKNVNFSGASAATTVAGIVTGSNVLGNAALAPNSNNVIQNNAFTATQNGIYLFGYATAPYDANWVINGNSFTTMGFRGMILQNASNFNVYNNTINGITLATASILTGIQLSTAVAGGNIYNNNITAVNNTGAAGGCNGIGLLTTTTASAVNVYNNFITAVSSTTGSTTLSGPFDNGYGIIVGSGGGYNIYDNSINMNVNQTSGFVSTAINVVTGVSVGGVDIRDNILVNAQTAGATRRPAIFCSGASNVFSNINYNDYFASTGVLGTIGATNCNTIALMTTNFGGNANSITMNPTFVSATDLHLQSVAGNLPLLAGTPIATPSITRDIDNDLRPVAIPTMGADEFGNVMSYVPLASTCSNGSITLTPDTIFSGIGIPTTGALIPRIYFKKNAGTWFSAPGTFLSGTANNGKWSFTIAAATMGGVIGSDVISYYVIAQTTAGVVFASPATGLVATNVNTVTTPPTTPNTYTVNAVNVATLTTSQSTCFNASAASAALYPYSGVTGSPDQYTLTWTPAGPTPVPAFLTLPVSPLSVNVPAGTPVGNYTGTITFKNAASGCTQVATLTLTVNGTPGIITGALAACTGFSNTLSNSVLGGTWSSSNAHVSIGSSSGIATANTVGTSVITYTHPCGTVMAVFTVNPAPLGIVGHDSCCVNGTTAFADITIGGVWSSSTTSIATVLTGSGLISGVTAGTSTITYSMGLGCYVTKAVTVLATPPAITGTLQMCPGTTTNLFNTSAGGTWSSLGDYVASVGSSTGVVTGVAADTISIMYRDVNGCATTAQVTVNPRPAAIIGDIKVCSGLKDSVYDATPGGTWSSSSTGIATIAPAPTDPSLGIINTVAGGTTVITYKLAATGCFITRSITLKPAPAPVVGYNVFTNTFYTGDFYASYQWYDSAQGIVPGATTYHTAAQYDGYYWVVVTDTLGCTGKSGNVHFYQWMLQAPSVGQAAVRIYPNPAKGMVFIESPVAVRAVVSGVDGKQMLEQQDAKQVDLGNLASGMYFIVLYDADNRVVAREKIVKE